MRKIIVSTVSLGVVIFLILLDVSEPVVESSPEVPPKSISSPGDGLSKSGDADLSVPARFPAKAIVVKRHADPTNNKRSVTKAPEPDARTSELWRLADLNMAQFYAVLWQTIETEDLEDADFREFVLATLDERGVHTPGEILAALIQTAPTPELRMNALRLLSEASQELSVDPFYRALRDGDPAIRETALAFFDGLSADQLLDAMTDAVLDRNRVVRLLAFSTMEDMHEFTPVWEVAELVLDDPDPQIRMRALELLTYGDHPAAIDHLALALSDSNPRVRELAEALLAELEQEPS